MGLETGAYIGDLNVANPSGTDPKSQGDDHIRLLKTAARGSFPGFAGVVLGTGVESGSSNAFVVTLSPGPAAYVAGMMVVFKTTHANSGAATLQVNALAAKTLKAVDGSALESGDIESGAIVGAFYDGTDFFLITANDRAARAGDTYTGTHDFTGATVQVADLGDAEDTVKAAATTWVRRLFGKIAGQVWTGVQNFTGATITVATAAPGTNNTTAASTAFATQLAFQSALPVQSVPAMLYSNGSAASWRTTFVGDSGTGGQLGPVPAPAAGDAAKYLRADGTWHLAPSAPDVIAQDQKANGTVGASLTNGGWRDRDLNTLARNVGTVGALAANVLTLPAGTWLLRARASMTAIAGGNYDGRARFYNNTDAAVIAEGENSRFQDGDVLEVMAIVTLAASKGIKLQTYHTTSPATGGSAITSGSVEIYATLEATRLA